MWTDSSGMRRGRFARDVYTYAHPPIVAGVILSAVAMEEMALHPSDPLPAAFRAMGGAGIVLYFGGVGIGVFRAFGAFARERFAHRRCGRAGARWLLLPDWQLNERAHGLYRQRHQR